jgi:DNA ligase-4
MPFLFSYVCDLLQKIENNLRAKSGQRNNDTIVTEWFNLHRDSLKPDKCDGAALLSTLLPHKRSDRVYSMQAARLEKHIGRAFKLGSSRLSELYRYKTPGVDADLADCVETILNETVTLIAGPTTFAILLTCPSPMS